MKTLFHDLAQVVTCEDASETSVLRHAAVLVEDDVILQVGAADGC